MHLLFMTWYIQVYLHLPYISTKNVDPLILWIVFHLSLTRRFKEVSTLGSRADGEFCRHMLEHPSFEVTWRWPIRRQRVATENTSFGPPFWVAFGKGIPWKSPPFFRET